MFRKIFSLIVLALVLSLLVACGGDSTPATQAPAEEPAPAEEAEAPDSSAEGEVIRIATEEYPPYTSENMKHYGIASHIVTEAFALEGITVEYEFFPGSRSYKLAEQGEMDGSLPWVYREEREKDFYFGEPVVAGGDDGFFHLKDFEFSWDMEHPDYNDLAGVQVGGIISYNYGELFQNAEESGVIEVNRIATIPQAFKMLLTGRIEVLMLEDKSGYYQLQSNFTSEEIESITHTREEESQIMYNYLLLSKKAEKGEYYLEKLNSGIKKLRDSGQYDEFIAALGRGDYVIK
ncbi:transporter substrate-binding domain-containing protein [Anaerolineales bacterium HSG25]|nr:transporter substrate-binding domain-containing protein [Anaerolineales bacterium HSG25]